MIVRTYAIASCNRVDKCFKQMLRYPMPYFLPVWVLVNNRAPSSLFVNEMVFIAIQVTFINLLNEYVS